MRGQKHWQLNGFGHSKHNPATYALAGALDRHNRPDAFVAKRAEHALADTEGLRKLVHDAGFREIDIRTATKTVRFPTPNEYVKIQFAATPLAAVIAQCDAAPRDCMVGALIEDMGAVLAPYCEGERLSFPASCLPG